MFLTRANRLDEALKIDTSDFFSSILNIIQDINKDNDNFYSLLINSNEFMPPSFSKDIDKDILILTV